MRARYSAHASDITNRAPQLLITYEYDETLMQGPPFSSQKQEIEQYYSERYKLVLLTCELLEAGLKGQTAKEYVWLLERPAY